MRYLNTKNIIAAGVLLSCMSSIAWGAIIPDRTRIIMNESDKGEALKNVMQVTMQHALKLFWRPKAIELEDDGVMTYEKVEIIRRNDGSIRFNNKMPYHVTLGYIGTNGVTMLPQTQSLMVTPFSYANTQFKNVPSTFQVGYINDFGGLSFYEINCPVVNNICNISVANRDQ